MNDDYQQEREDEAIAEEEFRQDNQRLCDPFQFLMLYTTPERAELLTSAYNTLLKLGYDAIVDETLTLVRESDNMTPDMVLSGFNSLVSYVQHDAVSKHGITLKPNTPIEIHDQLLQAIVLLADYDDVEQLMTSFEMSIMADPIDVFTDLLEEVLNEDLADEIALYIAGLSTAFLPAIKKYLLGILEDREDNDMHATMAITDDMLLKLRKQAEVADSSLNIQMPTLMGHIMPPNLEYRYYIAELVYRHHGERDMRTIAADMLMACTVCAEQPADPLKLISEYLIDFTDDINRQVEIMNRVKAILGELAIEPK